MNATKAASIAVVGPGAIGTAVAAALHEAGRTPLLCGRTPRECLTLQDGDRVITVPGPVQVDPEQLGRTVDLVFLAVKATQIEAAAEWLTALSGPNTVVCVLQNGVEQLEGIALAQGTTRPRERSARAGHAGQSPPTARRRSAKRTRRCSAHSTR